jgi:hypothetical protein
MGVSGQRHAQVALLPPGKGPPVPIVQEDGWAPEPVWTQARRKILCPRRGSNPDRPVVQPVVRHYTAWANPAPLWQEYLILLHEDFEKFIFVAQISDMSQVMIF